MLGCTDFRTFTYFLNEKFASLNGGSGLRHTGPRVRAARGLGINSSRYLRQGWTAICGTKNRCANFRITTVGASRRSSQLDLTECARSEQIASIKARSLLRSATSSSVKGVARRACIWRRCSSRASVASRSASGESSADQGSEPSRWTARLSGGEAVSATALRTNNCAFAESFIAASSWG